MSSMDVWLLNAARRTKGFMPEKEGLALYEAALEGGDLGPLVEIGTYCGKSTIFLAAAAREKETVVYTIDHHRGSEEHQPGEQYQDPELIDASLNKVDTLPYFRRNIELIGLDDVVVGIVGRSDVVARGWTGPVGLAFIDGGHSLQTAKTDYESWAPLVVEGGLLVIHDVFEDPEEGGRPPYEIYERALASKAFKEKTSEGSLRVLQREGSGS